MAYSYYDTVILPIRRNLQDTGYDCGPASIKIILETLAKGEGKSEKELIAICKTTSEKGTEPHSLSKALDKLMISHFVSHNASVEKMEKSLRELCICLVHYQSWGESGSDFKKLYAGHYSIIFGYDSQYFYIADPYKKHAPQNKQWGFRKIKKDLFEKRWNGRGDGKENNHHWMISVPLK